MKSDSGKEASNGAGNGDPFINKLLAIASRFNDVVFEAEVPLLTAKRLLELRSEYEGLLMTAIAENANLRGQIEVLQRCPAMSVPAERVLMPGPPAPALHS